MATLRSSKTFLGREMAGARALWKANGMKSKQVGKPIIAIVNSFTQFVPGHVHLHEVGQLIKKEIEKQGCFAAEFNTIAVDDGIAMGHGGMLYSLPSREIIADSVEYMCNAHCADAMICISNCDKITPGMLMAAMRLNIPAVFVSGGPMEAGNVGGKDCDLIDVMIAGGDKGVSKWTLNKYEERGCPTCGCCSGMFTANSMNCLSEAIGLAPVGNGTVLATHVNRKNLFIKGAQLIVKLAKEYYFNDNTDVLPHSIATKAAFENAMKLDIAMGGSTNTVLHLLAIAHEAGVDFTMSDVDRLSRGVMGILMELEKKSLLDSSTLRIDYPTLKEAMYSNSIFSAERNSIYLSAPGGKRTTQMGKCKKMYKDFDTDRSEGCIRDIEHAYMQDGGIAVLYGNIAPDGCIVKTAGVPEEILKFTGKAIVFESQEEAVEGILGDKVKAGDVVVIRYEGPKGGPGMQEMLYPTSFLKSKHLGQKCALITDGRFSGGTSGLSIGHISPEAANGGPIALIKDGDIIRIDVPGRTLDVDITEDELQARRLAQKQYKPAHREREVSKALKAYAALADSADKGGVRIIK